MTISYERAPSRNVLERYGNLGSALIFHSTSDGFSINAFLMGGKRGGKISVEIERGHVERKQAKLMAEQTLREYGIID